MRVPETLGFLKSHRFAEASANEARRAVANSLVASARTIEPTRWVNDDDSSLASILNAEDVVAELERHAEAILAVQRDM